MKEALKKRVLRTPMDRADGALGAKRLAVVVAVLVVAGALIIFIGQRYLASKNTWEATVTGVAQATVNFSMAEGSDDTDIASYPEGMAIEVGDKVLIRTDENEGNVVLEVLGE